MSTPYSAQSNPLVPPGFGGVPLPPAIPAPVQRAFMIWLGIIALNIVGTLVQTVLGYGGAAGLVGALVGGALGVYLALHLRGGRNWARITLTVLTGLALLLNLIGFFAAFVLFAFLPAVAFVTLVVCAGVLAGGIVALVNVWKAESNAYFDRMAL